MDDKSGMKKKPSAVSARPAIRVVPGRGPAAPASAGPPSQAHTHVQMQAASHKPLDMASSAESGAAEPAPNVKAYIERQLKSVYDDVLNQPIPDRFLDLLNELDQKTDADKRAIEDQA